jgi:hypothetical protein
MGFNSGLKGLNKEMRITKIRKHESQMNSSEKLMEWKSICQVFNTVH